MVIPCKDIASKIQTELKASALELLRQGIKLKLVDILIGDSEAQDSYVRIKARKAENLGIDFELVQLPEDTSQTALLKILTQKSTDPSVTGIIIQQPFPTHLNASDLFAAMPYAKEIEGHKPGSKFLMPIALAVLTAIKWLALPQLQQDIFSTQNDNALTDSLVIDIERDSAVIKEYLENKNIVILGRGPTGGAPIAKAFDKLGVSYLQIHSETENPDSIMCKADIIISAVGKKIIGPHNIKPGAILLNLGLHHDGERLVGDYAEDEVEDIAIWHTQTPGGLGPIDVLYLYANLIEAAKNSSENY